MFVPKVGCIKYKSDIIKVMFVLLDIMPAYLPSIHDSQARSQVFLRVWQDDANYFILMQILILPQK
jgi:hypothetical protein